MNLVLRCVFACIACLGFVVVSNSPKTPSPAPAAQAAAPQPATLAARNQ